MSHYPIFLSPVNHLGSAQEYRDLLLEVGFSAAEVIDVSRDVWRAHFLHHITGIHERFYDGKANIVELTEVVWKYYHMNAYVGPWVFVDARK
ncbi:hypothetical protein ACCP96_13325 [Xanthomonas campestris pv. fici]|uniref:hypothetical protein n=1 Tax=Xanthomonas euvesicatoria TaxID=456327 RepID=UPI003556B63C